jgi:hypothetical protein
VKPNPAAYGSVVSWGFPALRSSSPTTIRDHDGNRVLSLSEDEMTVYVYELPGQRHTLFGRSPMSDPWFGLTADTDAELHGFAARLGLTRLMFQPARQMDRRMGPPPGTMT